MRPLTFGSICSGIGGGELAFDGLADNVFMSEIEAFPRAVLQYRFPGHTLYGDFTDLVVNPVPTDVLVGGTPCFPAGTTVATKRGFLPIEEVVVGDEVISHTGKFRRVLRVGHKEAPTVMLKGQGHPCMETTAEHPFLSKQRQYRYTRINGKAVRLKWWSPAEWVLAGKMKNRHWAYPTVWPSLPIPKVKTYGNEIVFSEVDENLLTLAGMYTGDGWVRINNRRGCTSLGLNEKKAVVAREIAARCGLNITESKERTTTRIYIHGRAVARWLRTNFGHGAEHKTLPMWLLGAPNNLKKAFVEGYMETDGFQSGQPWDEVNGLTISKNLALNMRSLGISLGYASSIGYHVPPPTTVIEGRIVNQKPYWVFNYSTSTRSSVEMDGYRWQCVRHMTPTGAVKTVYNIEVEEDNSYLADGLIVHNCQGFSVAGKRLSLDDARSNLALGYIMLLDSIDKINKSLGEPPCVCLWENVPGVLSVKDNAFGCFLAALVGFDSPIVNTSKQGGKWPNSGLVSGPTRRAAWRILDAQYFGLAQRRKRVFVVASARDNFDPAQVLFESSGVQGDSSASKKRGKALPEHLHRALLAGAASGQTSILTEE